MSCVGYPWWQWDIHVIYLMFVSVINLRVQWPCELMHRGWWYVSNVSIIFDCSMLYYLLFWTLLGFIIHFYIIFGTNLLTGGPAQIVVFCLFQCFAEKEYQTESKRNETFGNVIFGTNVIQRTWSLRQESNKESTRQGGAPTPPPGAPSTLVGPILLHRRTSSSYIYLRTPKLSDTEPKTYFHRCNLLYPWDPILGPSGAPPEGALITEGFYINTIASPMMCE